MTAAAPEPPSITPPDWHHCGHGANTTDPIGCRGIRVFGQAVCLAHLADAARAAHLRGLAAGFDIDYRGTIFTESLLDAVLDALRDPVTRRPRFGTARFEEATFRADAKFAQALFQGIARFEAATFQGFAWFDEACFQGKARFGAVVFQGAARFTDATFQRYAWFQGATFQQDVWFDAMFQDDAWFEASTFYGAARFWARFQGQARFRSATFQAIAVFAGTAFHGDTDFESAAFHGPAGFHGATFKRAARFSSANFQDSVDFRTAAFHKSAGFDSAIFQAFADFESVNFQGDAGFEQSIFEGAARLGPLVCAGRVTLSGAVFNGPADLWLATRRLECRRTRWSSTAELRLRHATVDFAHAVFEYPLTIAAEAESFMCADGQPLREQALDCVPQSTVRMASLRGVDAAHLVLFDVDLSRCVFTGTVHLDQLRLEGSCTFAGAPKRAHGQWRWLPRGFTARRTLAEEHHWRASQPKASRGWNVAVLGSGQVGPAQLAPVYRALRKAFEDTKNEPGAADFYFGEMEMRRHDRVGTTRAERGLLHGYWLLSGYGLRASRALGWLAAAMLGTIVLMMGCGLPTDSPRQKVTGTVPSGGGSSTFEIDTADPQNPTGDRFTGERAEEALNVTLNSAVFRSSGRELTTAGTYIEMASRVTEPILLGLAVLAVRGRVKR
ncbi:pentapeptide repeat-containing protein [Streptomyces sp. NPDC054855]